MPDIAAAGTVTKSTDGFAFLQASPRNVVLLFAGTTVGTTCVVQYIDDQGVARTLESGTITVLPTSLVIDAINRDLQVVTTGSPDFNLTGFRQNYD